MRPTGSITHSTTSLLLVPRLLVARLLVARLLVTMLVLGILQPGCSLLPPSSRQLKASASDAAKVSVLPWLREPLSVPLSGSSMLLSSVLVRPEVAEHRLLLSSFAEKDRAVNNVGRSNFEDDCMVLLRGNDYWYFLEPLYLLESYAGEISLKAGDRLMTLPFSTSKFYGLSRQTGFEYIELDLGNSPQRVRVNGSMGDESVGKYLDELQHPAKDAWTMTVVTRWDGSQAHQLVLPANLPEKTVLEELRSVRQKLDRVYLQPGDVVQKTNFAEQSRRF